MLLSMYASYHWAKLGRKHYVLRMAVFIILVSYLSAIAPLPFGMLMPYPFIVSPVLSFPFYSWSHDVAEPESYTQYYGFGFLTITSTTATNIYWDNFVRFSFLIFLFVNFAGTMLGYGISKIPRIREWGTSTHWSLLGSVLAIIFLGGPYVLGPGDYGFANGALFLFGILVLAMVVGRILWSRMSETGTPFTDKLLELQEQMDKGVITQQEHEQIKRKLLERLGKLKEQLSSGHITQKEYEQKKKKLLEKSEA